VKTSSRGRKGLFFLLAATKVHRREGGKEIRAIRAKTRAGMAPAGKRQGRVKNQKGKKIHIDKSTPSFSLFSTILSLHNGKPLWELWARPGQIGKKRPVKTTRVSALLKAKGNYTGNSGRGGVGGMHFFCIWQRRTNRKGKGSSGGKAQRT